ncbi:MAG: 16S rRNA (guanine(527)-N(7))-methyltransferase RsmG [Kosmotogaceae bacterium]
MVLDSNSPEEKLRHFLKLLLNSPHNLTSIKKTEQAYIKHVEDIVKPFEGKTLTGLFIDVGTGGGMPGLVMAIKFPETRWVLIDSVKKKISEVERFVRELKLGNVNTLRGRAEELPDKYREYFDGAFSRAISKTDITLELCAPFVKNGGDCYIYKGPSWKKEKDRVIKACAILGFSEPDVIDYRLTDDSMRSLLICRKLRKTPKIFPRRVGKAFKKPIGVYSEKIQGDCFER